MLKSLVFRLADRCWLMGLLVIAAVPCPLLAVTLHTDDFQTDLGGWTTGGSMVTRVTSGGPAGDADAFLRLEPVFGNFATYNSTSEWTGDLAASGGIEITADMMALSGTAPLSMRVVLFGPGIAPGSASRFTSTVATEVPADGVWRNYTFSLREEDLTRVLGSDTYSAMAADLLRIMFRHDPGTPSSGGTPVAGDLGIDNITLQAASISADFNADGAIDGLDFLTWQRGGSPTPQSTEDLQAWQAQYPSPGSSAVTTPVPEPSSAALLAILMGVGFAGRR